MKKDTTSLRKFKQLQRELGIPLYQCVGVLETLWGVTIRETPMGGIGSIGSQGIADEIGWEGDPDKLVQSLVDFRWLDPHPVHVYVIHKWPKHAPNWLIALVKRDSLTWAVNDELSQTSCEMSQTSERMSQGLRVGIGLGSGIGSGSDEVTNFGCFLEWFHSYPPHRQAAQGPAQIAYVEAMTEGICPDMLLAKVIEYAASPLGGSRYAVGAAKWLTDRHWLDDPASWHDDGSNSEPPTRSMMDKLNEDLT